MAAVLPGRASSLGQAMPGLAGGKKDGTLHFFRQLGLAKECIGADLKKLSLVSDQVEGALVEPLLLLIMSGNYCRRLLRS